MNRDHFVIFEIASKYFISDSVVDYDGYSISSKKFLPTVVDSSSRQLRILSELNSPIPVHFSLLIPKTSMFTLAISFQFALIHDSKFLCNIALYSIRLTVTSTPGCWFCFGSIPSFFLELFLHWSPVVGTY